MPAIRGESTIYFKESRGVWACSIDLGRRPNGKRHRVEITAKSRNALIDKRRAKIREIEDGQYTPGSKPTMTAWWDHWIETIAASRVRPLVLATYRSYGRKHIAHIGHWRIDKLTVDDVRFLHAEMRRGGASSRSVQAVHATLSRCLKDAVRERLISTNPCDMMDRPVADSKERGAFSLAEVRAILRVAREDGPGVFAKWYLAFLVGERQGERLGLEWDRVDLDRGLADWSWQVQQIPWRHGSGCGCEKGGSPARCSAREPDAPVGFEMRPCYLGRWWTRPKTSASIRATPLPPDLVEALRAWREAWPPNGLGLVWADAKGRPVTSRDDRDEFRNLCRRAGVRELVVHSARHSMVSMLLDAGVSPEVIQQIAGHSSLASTRGYMHVSVDQARRALGSLDLT